VWLIRSVIMLLGVIAFLWLGMTNAGEQVNFNLFGTQHPALSLNLLMFIVFAGGMIFSFLIFIFSEFQLRYTISQQQKIVQRLERELSDLRNLPLEQSESVQAESELNV